MPQDITIKGVSTPELLRIRAAVNAELRRRDVCKHGVACGQWCELCNREYKQARGVGKERGE